MIPQPTAAYLHHKESSQRSWTFFPSKCIIFGCFNSFAFQACQEDDPCYKKKTHKKKTIIIIVFSKESVILNYMEL